VNISSKDLRNSLGTNINSRWTPVVYLDRVENPWSKVTEIERALLHADGCWRSARDQTAKHEVTARNQGGGVNSTLWGKRNSQFAQIRSAKEPWFVVEGSETNNKVNKKQQQTNKKNTRQSLRPFLHKHKFYLCVRVRKFSVL